MAPSIPRGVSWHPAPLPHPSGRCRRRRRGKEPHRLAVARFLCGRAARSGSAGTRRSCHGGCCCPFLGLRGTGATLLAWEHPGPGAELLGSPRSLLGLWGLAHGTRTASGSGPRMSGATEPKTRFAGCSSLTGKLIVVTLSCTQGGEQLAGGRAPHSEGTPSARCLWWQGGTGLSVGSPCRSCRGRAEECECFAAKGMSGN